MEWLGFVSDAGLCAPTNDSFQTWLRSIDSVHGSFCTTVNTSEDRRALIALYKAANGRAWWNNTGWLSGRPLRTWYGVTTDANGRVSGLYLNYNGLSGKIPPELGNLANLESLWLHRNTLSGEIPQELGNLANLSELYLHENELSGGIPPELGDLPNLEWLWLHKNRLSGEIPPELGSLANLESLLLSDNRLSEDIPPELGNLANLLSRCNDTLTGRVSFYHVGVRLLCR